MKNILKPIDSKLNRIAFLTSSLLVILNIIARFAGNQQQGSDYIFSFQKIFKKNYYNERAISNFDFYTWSETQTQNTDGISKNGRFYYALHKGKDIFSDNGEVLQHADRSLTIVDLEKQTEKILKFSEIGFTTEDIVAPLHFPNTSLLLLARYTNPGIRTGKDGFGVVDLETGKFRTLDTTFLNMTKLTEITDFDGETMTAKIEELVNGIPTDYIAVINFENKTIDKYKSSTEFMFDGRLHNQKFFSIGFNSAENTKKLIQIQDLQNNIIQTITTEQNFDHIDREVAPGIFLIRGNFNAPLALLNIENGKLFMLNEENNLFINQANTTINSRYHESTNEVLVAFIRKGNPANLTLNILNINNNTLTTKNIYFDFNIINQNINSASGTSRNSFGLPIYDMTYQGDVIFVKNGQGYILDYKWDGTSQEIPSDEVKSYFDIIKLVRRNNFLIKYKNFIPES